MRHRALCVASALIITSIFAPKGEATPICGEVPKVLVLLDRSGSMKEEVNGKSKWAIAKNAVTTISQKFPAQLQLGLMLYPRWPVVDACTNGEVNVPPATNNQVALTTALNTAYPSGNTPIIGTLDAAHDYLTALSAKERFVVLVSDGKETCLTPTEPLTQPGSCAWDGGNNFRKCGGCGWQFCLPDGTWSSACEAVPNLFTCPAGQTCGNDALCHGTATGSTSLSQAAARLMAAGIKTYVVGFGSQVDSQALTSIAQAGGTSSYLQAGNQTQLIGALQAIAADISCCGNGVVDAGETCDIQIPAGQSGACPTSCDDGDPCTNDVLEGQNCAVKCVGKPITAAVDGDGCCPAGANASSDSDCGSSCGNGILEPGETCDPKIPAGQNGACEALCDDGDPCTVDTPAGDACNPTCTHEPAAASGAQSDGCCPEGLTVNEDADCPPPCGPDQTTDCVDTCEGVTCPDGQHCVYGECVPWPANSDEGAGCDCRLGPTSAPAGAPALALLGLFLVLGLRRRR